MIAVFRFNPVGQYSAISKAKSKYDNSESYSSYDLVHQYFVQSKLTYVSDGKFIMALWIIMLIMFLITCASCTYVMKTTAANMKFERRALQRNTFTEPQDSKF